MTETLTERLDDAVDDLDGLTDWKIDADEGAVRFRARTRPTAAPVRRVPSSLRLATDGGGDARGDGPPEPNDDGRTWSLLVDLTGSETTD